MKQQEEQCETLTRQINDLEKNLEWMSAEQREKEGKIKEQDAAIDRIAKEALELSSISELL